MRLRVPASLRALGALLTRDLAAGRRGTSTAALRVLVVALSGLVAGISLYNADSLYARPNEAALAGWLIPWSLVVVSLLALPVLALQTLRHERESGRLDLLLLAGLSPRLLAFGRWLSSFLLLESLLLDALPAMAVFAYFGSPDLHRLAWGVVALTGWNALIAGFAVALSARIRRAGACVLAALAVLFALVATSVWTLSKDSRARKAAHAAPAPPIVLTWLTVETIASRPERVSPAGHAAGLAGSLAAGLLLAATAGRGLDRSLRAARTRTRTGRPRLRRALARLGRPGALAGEPLAWLLQRGAWLLRPRALAIVLLAAFFAGTGLLELRSLLRQRSLDQPAVLDPDLLVTAAGLAWLAALALAAFSTALQVARARERNEWDTLLSSARRGRSLVGGLLAGPFEAALVAAALAVGFLGLVGLVAPWMSGGDLPAVLAGALGLAGTLPLALGLGLAAGLCARSQAGAMGLCLLLLGLVVVEGSLAGAWLDGTALGEAFDAKSRASLVMLAASCVIPLQFLVLDLLRRRPTAAHLLGLLSLAALFISPPLFNAIMDTHDSRLFQHAPLVGLASVSMGLPLLFVLLRRPDVWLGRIG